MTAAPIMERLETAFHAPVLEAYAMTENAHQMCSNPLPKHGPHKAGSVGKPSFIELAILDDDCNVLPSGTIGEVNKGGAALDLVPHT
jgi:oxalate---CoA ligase